MGYCHLADIRNMVPDDILMQLTIEENAGYIDTDVINNAINIADNLINACCCPRFKVPFRPVPYLITYISAVFAVRNLLAMKFEKIPEIHEERYKDARNMLIGISKGKLILGHPEAAKETDGRSTGKYSERCRALMEDYIRARARSRPAKKRGIPFSGAIR